AVSTSVTPAVETYAVKTPITVTAAPGQCSFHIFVGPWSKFTDCDRAKDYLTKQGLSFSSIPAIDGKTVVTKVGDVEIEGWDEKKLSETLKTSGYPGPADKTKVNYGM